MDKKSKKQLVALLVKEYADSCLLGGGNAAHEAGVRHALRNLAAAADVSEDFSAELAAIGLK